MKSSYIKACLSAYYRFGKGNKLIATECGRFNADFLTIKNNQLTEIEIKVSKADLNNDFKKPKHRIYASNSSPWVPNYFYFCVPAELLDYAIAKCADKPYGILVAKPQHGIQKQKWSARDDADVKRRVEQLKKSRENFKLLEIRDCKYGSGKDIIFEASVHFAYKERIRVIKRAKKMNDNIPQRKIVNYLIARLSSEMANLRIEFERVYNNKDEK